MYQDSLFHEIKKLIDPECDVIFVADLFVEDYCGGAELTTQSLIDESPLKVMKLHSKFVTLEALKQGHDKMWIFGNFSQLNSNLIPTIVGNMKYAILEYDFKYCRYRSPEKHVAITGTKCDCAEQMNGKVVSTFYHGAKSLWWMSEKQMEHYHSLFPFLTTNDNFVLSSVFDKKTLLTFKLLRQNQQRNNKWVVLGSDSWIKGYSVAEQWCQISGKESDVIWNLPYEETLKRLSTSEGFVYLPPGFDTCPRMAIEAKLLGCKLELNSNVLHKDEEWFATDDIELIESYLYKAPEIFWNGIREAINYKPTISGYVTTYNCMEQAYPYQECIQSLLKFCDEVVVLDGGSTDGTYDVLRSIADQSNGRLIIDQNNPDWSHPRFAVFDGQQKARARILCTKEFCIQVDADEVFHEEDGPKIIDLISKFPKNVDLLALPVIEFWGAKKEKVRLDITPWKWRLSRNNPNITHGIPRDLRMFDENGQIYSRLGSDGCDYIFADTFKPVPFVNFYVQEVENVRRTALMEDPAAIQQYQDWFNNAIEQLPSVFHYSWVDFERKIRLYKNYWQNHWQSLYNMNISDTSENNMFFEKPWKDVTDEDITKLAGELEKTGGHIFHTKFNHEFIPSLKINRSEPASMK